MSFAEAYLQLLSDFRLRAGGAVLLVALSGLLEGVALLALIPLLQGNQGPGSAFSAGFPVSFFVLMGTGGIGGQVLIFSILGILSALARFAADSMLLALRTDVESHLRVRMSKSLMGMAWSHFLGLRLGDVSHAVLSEAGQIAMGVNVFLSACGTALVILALLGAALVLSPMLTFYTAIFGAVGFVLFRVTAKWAGRPAQDVAEVAEKIGDISGTTFANLKFVRASGNSELALVQAVDLFQKYARAAAASGRFGHLMRLVLEFGAVFMVGAFLWVVLGIRGGSAASTMVFLVIFYRLSPRLFTLQDNLHQCRVLHPWYVTWKRRLDRAVQHPQPAGGALEVSAVRQVQLANVSFSYPGTALPAIQGLSFSMACGECIALVGPSGGGKSTLVDLILGLLEPTSGEICIDGTLLGELHLDHWRRRIGLVLQESPIFHASVLHNIAWGFENPDPARAEQAARMAHAWEFIEPLPQGMETVVGEKGGRLSGGQRQRLALARALYREPSMLILDEATSALDSAAEAEVQKALEQIKGHCTILMVSHRIKTVQLADLILVLEAGRLVEEGSWAELMARPEGRFREMAKAQGFMS